MLLTSNIHIEPLQPFSAISEIMVESSFKNLTDTATVKFPRNTKLKDKNLRDVLKKGQWVNLEMGYNGKLYNSYAGYISAIKPNIPFELNCEDDMWKLKQKSFSASHANISLKKLVADMVSPIGVKFDVKADIELGKMRIEKKTIAKVLQGLKESHGLYAFFVKGVLYVGTPYLSGFSYANEEERVYEMGRNIVGSDLEYTEADEMKIKIEAISILPNNKQVKASVGDEDGETHTLHFYGIEDEKQLKKTAEAEISKLKISGYKGSFTTMGDINSQHGQKAKIVDPYYPERQGTYRIEAVQTTFGTQGFKRKITLGAKTSN